MGLRDTVSIDTWEDFALCEYQLKRYGSPLYDWLKEHFPDPAKTEKEHKEYMIKYFPPDGVENWDIPTTFGELRRKVGIIRRYIQGEGERGVAIRAWMRGGDWREYQ